MTRGESAAENRVSTNAHEAQWNVLEKETKIEPKSQMPKKPAAEEKIEKTGGGEQIEVLTRP